MSTADLTGSSYLGRRLSGSSSKVSLRDEDMEMLDFNINDISRASSPASVSAKSEGHLQRDRRHRHSFRGDEDYRRRYHKLKSELEVERSKVKHMNKDKIEEMRQIREYYEKERKQEHAALQKKYEEEKKKEVARLKEELIRQKDYELQQVLKYKEDEIRHYRATTPSTGTKTPMSERSRTPAAGGRHTPGLETPRTPRVLERAQTPDTKEGNRTPSGAGRQTPAFGEVVMSSTDRARTPGGGGGKDTPGPSERARTPGGGSGRFTPMLSREEDHLGISLKESQTRVNQLEDEIQRLNKERDDLKRRYKAKCEEDKKKDKEFAQMKEEYDNELRRVIGEYKKVALGNLQKLKIAEHALKEGSMTEDDVLQIPLSNPDKLQIRRLSASSDGGAMAAGAESGDEGLRPEPTTPNPMSVVMLLAVMGPGFVFFHTPRPRDGRL
ncbi:hypothetical protein BaRGS_00030507 [Batillaria attramentaria]|uniref:Uncharacterized protein n=1 Tax=Batillaria attramentaria TaxID=370345 RepID=A0ABD0JT59_9CAEN